MAQNAHITSLDALETFRSQLIVYLEKLKAAVDDVSDDVMRTRVWLEHDQRLHLEGEVRRRAKVLEMAQQELFSSRISSLEQSTLDRQLAVRKAKNALDESMQKLTTLKQWDRRFESEVDPLAKQIDKMRTMLGTDMEQAVVFLTQAIKTLDEYARLSPPPSAGSPVSDSTTAEETSS